MELNPNNANANCILAIVCKKLGKLEEAVQRAHQAMDLDPLEVGAGNDVAWFLASRGGRLEEALALAQRAVQIEPDDPNYRDTLGWAHFQREEYPEAEAELQQAIEKFGGKGGAAGSWYRLGQVYEKQGKMEEAREAYHQALGLKPGHSRSQEALERLEPRPGMKP